MGRFIALGVATWFGSGMIPKWGPIPKMPGTWGSIFAIPMCVAALLLASDIKVGYLTPALNYAFACYVVFMAGIWSVPTAERSLGAMVDGYGEKVAHDQGQIVIDEVVGMMVSCAPLLWVRPGTVWYTFMLYAIACGLFRLADIYKPWPVKCFDRMGGAFGVMFDDVVAGVYAAVGLSTFNHFLG